MLGKKKTEEKKDKDPINTAGQPPLRVKEPAPRHHVTLARVENGWMVEELHSNRRAIARTWPEAVAHATAFAGEGVLVRRDKSWIPIVEFTVCASAV